MSTRVDDLEYRYRSAERLGQFSWTLFIIGGLLSLATVYSDLIPSSKLAEWVAIVFTLVVISQFAISQFNSRFVVPSAEAARRKQLLSDALGVPLSSETTVAYYNNEFPPSIDRLAASVLENSFFGKNILAEMAKWQRIRIGVYALIWLAGLMSRDSDLAVISILTQLLFSGEILARWIDVERLRHGVSEVYDRLHAYFLSRNGDSRPAGTAVILDAFATYESAKSAAAVQQSSTVFSRMNPELSRKWDDIRSQLGIAQQAVGVRARNSES